MPKMTIRVILKSGAEFPVKCDEFTITRNGLQQFTGYNFKGITENKPLYLDFEQVAAVLRVISDETPDADAQQEEKEQTFTETETTCPFCEDGTGNAKVYEDKKNKEFFVYCPRCGIETKDTFTSRSKAIKAFCEGKTRKIAQGEAGEDD